MGFRRDFCGRLTMRRDRINRSSEPSVEYLQIPDEPISFSLGDASAEGCIEPPSLWHLALAHPDECKQHLFPLLANHFTCCYRLPQRAAAVEAELLRVVAHDEILSRQQITELIGQLGDYHFAQREAADRRLRGLGMWISSPLEQLDLSHLDAEQQFRIRRILAAIWSLEGGPDGREKDTDVSSRPRG